MNKTLKLPIDLKLAEYSGQSVFYVRLRQEALRDWCLGLCLLNDNLIDILVIADESERHQFDIRIFNTKERAAKAKADFTGDVKHLNLTVVQLDYLLAFCLKYYRDGIAEVDHIDIETVATGTKSKDAYITITVPESKPPMTPDKLRTLLS